MDWTHADLAQQLGCGRSMVAMLVIGHRTPSLHLAVRIESLTAGWPLGPIRPWEWAQEERVSE